MNPTKLEQLTDKIVSAFSPEAGLRRKVARAHMFRYEAAQYNRLRQNATVRPQSPESSMYQSDRQKILWQCRDLAENEPLVKSILIKISNYALGKIRYQSMSGNPEWDSMAEKYFAEWCMRCDITGRHTFQVLCRLLLISSYRDGDGGFNIVNDGTTGEFRLQSIEADRIGNPYDVTVKNDYIGGIGIDPVTGQPKYYRIFRRDPQNSTYSPEADIPSNSFIHFFDPLRMDQYRGISAFAQSLNTIRDIHEILESEKMAVKMASTITGIVKTEMGDALQGTFFNDTVEDPTGNTRSNAIETMEPGQWRYLMPGEDISTFKSDRPSTSFQGFLEMLVRYVALSVNLPYGFVYDLSKLSGPSVRQDSAQAEREFSRVQDLFSEKVLNPIKTRVLARAIDSGLLPSNPGWNRGKWQFPALPTIDVGRESAAAVQEVNAGMRTLSDWYGEQGKDVSEELEQSAKEAKLIKDLAVKYEIDPQDIRMLTPNGNPGQQSIKSQEEDAVAKGNASPEMSDFIKTKKEYSKKEFSEVAGDIYRNLESASDTIIRKYGVLKN